MDNNNNNNFNPMPEGQSPGPVRPPFESRMTRAERALTLFYVPVHMLFLPMALGFMLANGMMSEAEANFLCYAIGLGFVLVSCMGFLRREFDPLCDRPVYVLSQILISYGLMFIMNLGVNAILGVFSSSAFTNPNNMAISSMADSEYGKTAAIAVILAPVVEEVLFRGALFGTIRKKSRVAAYTFTIVFFALYHVWGYMLYDWKLIIYALQYVPITYLLCRVYERTGTLWGSIFLHMLVNGIAINLMQSMEGLV